MAEKYTTTGIDHKYIEAFNRGKEWAFEQIHNHFFIGLHFFAAKVTGNKEEGKDIASTVMARLWERRGNFETYLNIKAFLYISTRNLSLNFLNKHSRQIDWDNVFNDDQEPWDIETQKHFYSSESLQALLHIMQELPERQASVLRLWYLDDVPADEIAKLMGIQRATVYVLKMKGLDSLYKIFTERKLEDLFVLMIILEYITSNKF